MTVTKSELGNRAKVFSALLCGPRPEAELAGMFANVFFGEMLVNDLIRDGKLVRHEGMVLIPAAAIDRLASDIEDGERWDSQS